MTDIGKRIRQLREEKGMSQQELAERVGYKSRASINKIELERDLPITKIARIAKALDTTPEFIMGWDVTPDSNYTPEALYQQYAYFEEKRELFNRIKKQNSDIDSKDENKNNDNWLKRFCGEGNMVYMNSCIIPLYNELNRDSMAELEEIIMKLHEKQRLKEKIASMQEELRKMEEGN